MTETPDRPLSEAPSNPPSPEQRATPVAPPAADKQPAADRTDENPPPRRWKTITDPPRV